jgi:hypothetical protein
MAEFQSEPIEDGSEDASRDAKVDGIVDQVKSDAQLGNVDDIDRVLRERLDEAGISVDDAEFDRIRGTLETD